MKILAAIGLLAICLSICIVLGLLFAKLEGHTKENVQEGSEYADYRKHIMDRFMRVD